MVWLKQARVEGKTELGGVVEYTGRTVCVSSRTRHQFSMLRHASSFSLRFCTKSS